ncbi:MAG: DHHA1 domain-containing protein [Tissierellales bacterium]
MPNIHLENRSLREKLSKYIAKELLQKAETINGINIIQDKLEDMKLQDAENIAKTLNSMENNIILLGIDNFNNSQFIVSRSSNLDINLKTLLSNISKQERIKGGGSPQTVQGACNREDLNKILNTFYDEIKKTLDKINR